ncbi:adenylate/guanylate cyclase domain-containing protein [Speluncibacter jeojiensis]|uniref:adenylate/guanylate cyclase domain-containing protein n=1 Tax=Speluncibacter jeojiensis TaxID=2710754 RepID=UPI00240EDD02|nr:adenylate/guanylate cyclase domain-containing protein [Rhodococcus sp. D2-41]
MIRRSPLARYAVGMVLANMVGAVVVFTLLRFVLPLPGADQLAVLSRLNYIVFAAYMPVALALGATFGTLVGRPVVTWLTRGGSPDPREHRAALRQPIRQVWVQAGLWAVGVVLFTAINVRGGEDLMMTIAITVVLGGAAACSIVYVIGERVLRPITARAMAAHVPRSDTAPGITLRILLIWALSTAIPVFGIGLIALAKLTGHVLPVSGQIAASALTLAVIALVVGLVGMTVVARSISDPVRSVSQAMEQVEHGNTDTSVSVYDGSEIGQLQTGFNRMVKGLAEREQLKDLLVKHVGEDVARKAVQHGTELGGIVREVAVLFVDIIGSTRLAETRPPGEVVGRLNEFFAIVVDVVGAHGGFVNKFEGDAALAIFGAPQDAEDAAGSALAAARELRARVKESGRVDVGIGVSSGPAVAGNVGAAERFEYTVIGDPVNEAARLTELAKRRRSRVLSTDRTVAAAGESEAEHWRLADRVTLRGRSTRTRLAEPVRVDDDEPRPTWQRLLAPTRT